MEFDFEVENQAWRQNVVADVPSRQFEDIGTSEAIFMPRLEIFNASREEITSSPTLQKLVKHVQEDKVGDPKTFQYGLLL